MKFFGRNFGVFGWFREFFENSIFGLKIWPENMPQNLKVTVVNPNFHKNQIKPLDKLYTSCIMLSLKLQNLLGNIIQPSLWQIT